MIIGEEGWRAMLPWLKSEQMVGLMRALLLKLSYAQAALLNSPLIRCPRARRVGVQDHSHIQSCFSCLIWLAGVMMYFAFMSASDLCIILGPKRYYIAT